MNPQDPLANLHPLRQPELIGWWPPAPGWWLLLGLVLIAIGVLVYLLRRRRRRNAYRRRALAQLHTLHAQYQSDSRAVEYLGSVNALLKSVALHAYPRDTVASRHGADWREFLNASLPPELQLHSDFDNAVYRNSAPEIDLDRVHAAAQHWIKQHRGTV
ncbi:MAG: DUF4381 domain-containing protein [Halioglobus sp.]|nr:DUF4381 domain-containing protein [Halioglobus sp.]